MLLSNVSMGPFGNPFPYHSFCQKHVLRMKLGDEACEAYEAQASFSKRVF